MSDLFGEKEEMECKMHFEYLSDYNNNWFGFINNYIVRFICHSYRNGCS